ncbi:MAG: hypothetical protein AAB509_00655, partial [Patescibacteria group bacterium]
PASAPAPASASVVAPVVVVAPTSVLAIVVENSPPQITAPVKIEPAVTTVVEKPPEQLAVAEPVPVFVPAPPPEIKPNPFLASVGSSGAWFKTNIFWLFIILLLILLAFALREILRKRKNKNQNEKIKLV